ncbi:MAG: flagellar assembly protein FliW, partial [Methylococcales bacterium]
FTLTDAEEALLQIDNIEDIVILILLHKDEENNQPTIKGSIKAPLVINTAKRIGLQKILQRMEQSITLTETSNEIAVSEGA